MRVPGWQGACDVTLPVSIPYYPLRGVLQAMKTTLTARRVRWKLVANGKTGNQSRRFALLAEQVEAVTTTDVDVVVQACDLRGALQAGVGLDEATAIMRAADTVLPHHVPATEHRGMPTMLGALQRLHALRAVIPSAQAAAHSPTAVVTGVSRGSVLTDVVLGVRPGDAAAAVRRRAQRGGDGAPRLVLCRGQTTEAGLQRVGWAQALKCKCSIPEGELMAALGLPRARAAEQRRPKCGDAGRVQARRAQRQDASKIEG
eukprot:COSAG01_NODE_1212_length_11214_cov_31.716689_3_plen_259_part_00